MTFSVGLPKVLRRNMGLNTFGESYNVLLGFSITIVVEILKWEGQKPRSKHEFAILITLCKHILSLRICLRWLQESLSGLGAEVLLHLAIVIINSFSENPFYWAVEKADISSSTLSLMKQWWAVFNELYNVCHRLLILRHSWLLYLIVSMARSFCLLTQFISFQRPCFVKNKGSGLNIFLFSFLFLFLFSFQFIFFILFLELG